jgi:hypothetical protein
MSKKPMNTVSTVTGEKTFMPFPAEKQQAMEQRRRSAYERTARGASCVVSTACPASSAATYDESATGHREEYDAWLRECDC